MRSFIWLAACVLAGGMIGTPARAQLDAQRPPAPATSLPASAQATAQPSGAVPLATAVEAAWQRAVATRESAGQRQRAEAERVAASSVWAAAPALELNHRDGRWHDSAAGRETEVGLAWPLLLPGQRAARVAAADAGIAVAEQARDAARLRIAGEVREAAWSLFAQQAALAQAEARVRSLSLLADDVDRRVRAGDLARADALASRAELLDATAQQSEARQRLHSAGSHWRVLTGLDAPPSADDDRPVAPAAMDRLASHPELLLASQQAARARRKLELLRVSRRDAPELTVGVRQDVSGRGEPSRNSFAVGLRLPFGTDDRNRPLEAAALAELDVAETSEQRLRERLQAEALAADAAVRAAEQQLAAARDRAALLGERAALIDKSFRAGESPLPELLRAMSAAAQADASLARQRAALGLSRARHEQSLGILP